MLGLAAGCLEQKVSPNQRGCEGNPFPHLGCDFGRSLRELGAQTYETSSGMASTNTWRVCLQVFLLCIAMPRRATTDSGDFNLSLLYICVSCSHTSFLKRVVNDFL